MAQIHWAKVINGDFNDAADWTGGDVPGASNDAILDASGAAFTVTANGGETVSSIQTTSNATLQITGSFTAADGTGIGVTAGVISVQNGATLTLQGSVDDTGEIYLYGGNSPTTIVIGAGGVTLTGGFAFGAPNASAGSIVLSFLGGGQQRIIGATATTTLTNVNARITGLGDLGCGQLIIDNEAKGFIEAKGRGTLVIDTGANTIVNAGLIDAEGAPSSPYTPTEGLVESPVDNTGVLKADGAGASLIFEDAVTGSEGCAVIYGGTLQFDAYFNQDVGFTGDSGDLVLAQSQNYTREIVDFSPTGGEALDLRDIGFVSAGEATFIGTASGGVLTVTDGTHTAHITLRNRDYLGSTFVASSDGDGGTRITDTTPLHWLNPVSANFSVAADWTGGVAPGADDNAILDASGSTPYTVTASTPQSVATIQTAATATLEVTASFSATNGTGFGANAGAIIVRNASFTIGGVFDNTGLIEAITGTGGGVIVGAVDNTGILKADGGSLTVEGAVTGAGRAVIDGGTLDFTASFSQNVALTGQNSVLELGRSQSYAGVISGFGHNAGQSLDLRDIGFVSVGEAVFVGKASGGVLAVTDRTHTAHIALVGDYLASTFVASSDGHGGVTIVDSPTSTPATHPFIAAMAGFGAPTGGSTSAANATNPLADTPLATPATPHA